MSTCYHIISEAGLRYTYTSNALCEYRYGHPCVILWNADIYFTKEYARVVGVNYLDLPIDFKINLGSYEMLAA